MSLLDGKRVLVTGALTNDSIAFHAAELAQAQGAEVSLTSFGRARRMTERAARGMARPADVLELDGGFSAVGCPTGAPVPA